MSYSVTAPMNYNFPTSIRFGASVVQELGPHLLENNKKRPLFVCDPGLAKLQVVQQVLSKLKENNLSPQLFTSIDKNPVKKNVLAGVEEYKKNLCDSIIGFGGGASMDVARAIALGVHHKRDLFDYDDAIGGDRYVTEEIPYFVTIPTTAGTGSEVGRSTVIADDETHEKKILFSPRLLAKKVFVDPELSMQLPAFVTAATGMDALTHNVEAYLVSSFSPLCDGIALEGIRLIAQSLERATLSPTLEYRAKMLMGSLMGATAFQKGLGIVHSLAHPLSTVLDMHHGLANAIMISYGMEFNRDVCEQKMKTICEVAGLSEKSSHSFLAWLEELNSNLKLPLGLKSYNINDEQLNRLCRLAVADPCHQSNPKKVTEADFRKIYLSAMENA